MGALQLMDGLQAGVGRGSSSTGAFTPGPAMPSTPEPRGGASPLPPAFLDDLAAHLVSQEQEESWTEILTLMGESLRVGWLGVPLREAGVPGGRALHLAMPQHQFVLTNPVYFLLFPLSQ